MSEPNNDNEKAFYENVAKVASTINQRLQGSIAPGGTNATVGDDSEAGEAASDQLDLAQENNYFPL